MKNSVKINRSPIPFLAVLIFFVVAIPLMDYVLLGFNKPHIEKSVIQKTRIYASSVEPCNDQDFEQEYHDPSCE